MPDKKLVVVLSMGRTGSSAITRSLKVLGVDLGRHLLRKLPKINPTGLWEDAEIEGLNDEILYSLNTTVGSLATITKERINCEVPEEFKERAIELLKLKTDNCDIFGFKDIRVGQLLPFWKEVFKELSVSTTYIMATRNPVSVAQSQKKISEAIYYEENTYLRWLQHTINTMQETATENRIVVDYDLLMMDPTSQVYRIAKSLGIDQSKIEREALSEYSHEFLNKSLRHHLSPLDEIKKITFAQGLTYKIYETLLKLAKDQLQPNSTESIKFFVDCTQKLNQIAPAIQAINDIDSSLIEAKRNIEKMIIRQLSNSIQLSW